MKIRQILEEKGRAVFTMRPTATLQEAAKELAERRIGALVLVDEDGGVAGILSERDIVRSIGTMGADCLSSRVADVMTIKVVTCSEDALMQDVMEIMTRGRFRHVPVADGGKLVGIISIGDVVKLRIEEAQRDADDMRSYIAAAG